MSSLKGILPLGYFSIIIFCKCAILVCSQPQYAQEYMFNKCQQKSTSGQDYVGVANTTIEGIPCQKWSDTQPHDHPLLSLMWEITISVGIPLEVLNLRSGVILLIPIMSSKIAQFHSVPHGRPSTFHWTTMTNLTKKTVTRRPLFKRKTFLRRSLSVLLSWWRPGRGTRVQCF